MNDFSYLGDEEIICEEVEQSYFTTIASEIPGFETATLDTLDSPLLNTSIVIPPSVMDSIPEPKFSFCGCFSGKDTISAARWLKKLEFELAPFKQDGSMPPRKFLESVDLLLTDDAAEWAETCPDAVRLLADENPTAQSMTTFRNLFQERFPAKSVETSTVSFDLELSNLHQKEGESISFYYRRVCAFMLRVGAKDKSTDGTFTLSLLEAATLDVILKAFVRGLADADIRKDTIRGLNTSGRSLRGVCSLAEDVERSKKELLKFLDEDF